MPHYSTSRAGISAPGRLHNTADDSNAAPKNINKLGAWARLKRCLASISNRNGASARRSNLVGNSVTPDIGDRYGKNLKLSGTGEILGVRNLSKHDYRVILEHVIAPLSQTPAPTKAATRTPAECIIAALAATRTTSTDKQVQQGIEHIVRATWLDSDLSRQGALNVLCLARMEAANHPELVQKIDEIQSTIEKKLYVTRRNDNLYGRLFETHLAEFLVDHPDSDMLIVRDRIAAFMHSDMLPYSTEQQDDLARQIAAMMRADPAPWCSEIEIAQTFIAAPTSDNLKAMLGHQGRKSVPLLLSLAVKYTVAAPGLKPLLQEASAFYMSVIVAQRSLRSAPSGEEPTDMHGLLYPYQRGAHPAAARSPGSGIRPMDVHIRPGATDPLTLHDWNALEAERTIGIGMSGSSNILAYIFRTIAAGAHDFPMTAAHLATAAWAAHSGGHSFNEAYSVFGYEKNNKFLPLSFRELELQSSSALSAIDFAFSKMMLTGEKLYGLEGGSPGR